MNIPEQDKPFFSRAVIVVSCIAAALWIIALAWASS